MSDTANTLCSIANGEAPMLETLADMDLDTRERSGLDTKTYMMVRVAGLVAMDAPPVSYDICVGEAHDVLDLEDLQGILVALTPVVGSARVASAAASILDVFFVDVDDDEPKEPAQDEREFELV
jgi:4-carboxymuconolactone decarboxylase